MKAKDIYWKTMKFTWLKLAVGAVLTVAVILLFALFVGIGAFFGGAGMYIGYILWLITSYGTYRFLMMYAGYMVKAAHVAVISTAVTTGEIPDDMFNAGKEMVKERFVTANAYFAIDKLVSGAVKQLQNTVGRVGNIFSNIPGVSDAVNILQLFIGIALGYIDECCLGYTFINKEQNAFKSACDGVCIYFQNAKHLLKNAAIITLVVVISTFFAWVIPFAVVGGLFTALHWSRFAAFILAVIIAIVIKTAFIDSWMMVKMMVSYMEVAPSTEITFDLYDKLCKISSKFKSMFKKAAAGVEAAM